MGDFVLTEREIAINIWMSTAGSFLSLILCSTVLGLAYYVWSRPKVRSTLNRVSFRLLLWTMAFEIVYDIAYMLVEFDAVFRLSDGLCTSSVYFLIFAMTSVNYLCTSIAVNLMITLTFGLNPVKLGLEKYYVGGSIALGALVPLVPAILGHFRNDPVWGVCWISADSIDELLLRHVLDLYLWQILSCFIATASVLTVLTTLYRQGRATSAALMAGNQLNSSIFEQDEESGDKRGRRAFLSRRAKGGHKRDTTMGQLEGHFMRIALLVSCYPISLILVNGIITVGELCVTRQGGITSTPIFALYCIYYALYGFRGTVFAALAFFIDPCFRRGLAAAWRTGHETAQAPAEEPVGSRHEEPKHSFAEMLSSPTPVLTYGSIPPAETAPSGSEGEEEFPIRTQTRSSDGSSLELPLALGALAHGAHVAQPPMHISTEDATRSFVGVPTAHLPADFTDDLDVVKPSEEVGAGMEGLESLAPDLPDEEEGERLRRRASVARRKAEDEQDQVDMEEMMRVFLETKALL